MSEKSEKVGSMESPEVKNYEAEYHVRRGDLCHG